MRLYYHWESKLSSVKIFLQIILVSIFLPIFMYITGPIECAILDIPILLFFIGIIGALFAYKNKTILFFIVCIETMLLGVLLSLIIISLLLVNDDTPSFALAILALAACETAIGMGLIVNAYRTHRCVYFTGFRSVR